MAAIDAEAVCACRRSCSEYPSDLTLEAAQIILGQHRGHGPGRVQFLAALKLVLEEN